MGRAQDLRQIQITNGRAAKLECQKGLGQGRGFDSPKVNSNDMVGNPVWDWPRLESEWMCNNITIRFRCLSPIAGK